MSGHAGRSLLLLRHAKSAWPSGVADVDRPLTRRGERAADLVGRFLLEHSLVPDRVVSSPAPRARQTAERVMAAMGGPRPAGLPGAPPAAMGDGGVRPDVLLDERLYDGDVWAAVGEHLGRADRLLMVGHEPDLVEVVRRLSGAEVRLPTATLVWLDLPGGTPTTPASTASFEDVGPAARPGDAGVGSAGGVTATVRLVLPPKLLDAPLR
jgi:phosphohistidine phosphatase